MSSQNIMYRQQQQRYRSNHLFMDSKPSSSSNDQHNTNSFHDITTSKAGRSMAPSGRKRRVAEEDEVMEDSSTTRETKYHHPIHTIKRNRASLQKQLSLEKLLSTMDKGKLIDLINDLVDSHPHLQTQVDAHIPPHTIEYAPSPIFAGLPDSLTDIASQKRFQFSTSHP